MALYADMEKPALKFKWKCKRPKVAKITLRTKDKVGVFQTMWSWNNDRQTNTIELRV